MKTCYVAVGVCERCGKEFVRSPLCTDAACDCQSVTAVPLHPALILPDRLHAKFQRIADLAGIGVEDFINALLMEALKQKLKEKMITYEL